MRRIKFRIAQSRQHFISIVFIHKSYNIANVKSSYQIFSVFFFKPSFVYLFVCILYNYPPKERSQNSGG